MHLPPALRHRRFVLIWVGLLISLTGSQMQQWALFWHISQLSRDPIAVSIVGGVRFTAILTFSLVGGLAADRFNRRYILFVTQSVLVLVALVLGYLTFVGVIQLWHIYLLTAIQAAAAAFDLPARQSLVPNLVPREDLPSAFSLQSIAFNTGAITGPALSGIVIAYLGQHDVYFINALTFLAVIVAIILIGPVAQVKAGGFDTSVSSLVADLKDGIRFIRSQPLILSSMILDFLATFFASANTLLPYFARYIIHVNEVAYGWLAAAQAIGAVVVGVFVSQMTRLHQQGRLLIYSVIIFGVGTILFGLSRVYFLVFLCLVLIGGADSLSTIIRNTIRQLNTPDHLRGRMTSINQIFFMGGPQLGEVEAGAVAQFFGVPMAILTGGIGTILAVGWIAKRWPVLLGYTGDEPVIAGVSSH